MSRLPGYWGSVLEVDLSTGRTGRREIPAADYEQFIGGRGLGMKLLWDLLPEPGADPLGPDNPLLFMPGPFAGFPLPSASRTCVVTKSPITAPVASPHRHASTVSYSNMGGFIGPEIRFAGYDGILVRGRAAAPVYLYVDDDRVEIRDAGKYWGMGTDAFDRAFTAALGDRRFRTCYIGPAGENLVPYASVINTAARAAGRAGTGCVMGAKNLKAVAVRGSRQPDVAAHKRFLEALDKARAGFHGTPGTENWRRYGTGSALVASSDNGTQAVRNFREGTFEHIERIGGLAARRAVWQRDFACYACPLACKKAGRVADGPYPGLVHDGPEYETGTMLGANLLIGDLGGVQRAIWHADDLGLDIISVGGVIGFLMEAYERGCIDRDALDGLDLAWGNVDATIELLHRIAHREGVGDAAARGVRHLAGRMGRETAKFAIHSKGHGFAAWNVHVQPGYGVSYATSNRGACHLNGFTSDRQNGTALVDSVGVCLFARGGYAAGLVEQVLESISGRGWVDADYVAAGERVFNLEKCFNYREGFRRADDSIPDRFFEEPLTMGPRKGAVVARDAWDRLMAEYYAKRDWDPATTRPADAKLQALGLEFARAKLPA